MGMHTHTHSHKHKHMHAPSKPTYPAVSTPEGLIPVITDYRRRSNFSFANLDCWPFYLTLNLWSPQNDVAILWPRIGQLIWHLKYSVAERYLFSKSYCVLSGGESRLHCRQHCRYESRLPCSTLTIHKRNLYYISCDCLGDSSSQPRLLFTTNRPGTNITKTLLPIMAWVGIVNVSWDVFYDHRISGKHLMVIEFI